ncbi:MAG: response regulator transcription factor [Terriglobales bacterium]
MNSLRLLVADDHEIVRRGLIALLKSHAGWEVCGEAEDGRSAVDQAKALRPDVVVLDIGMPHLNGLDAARQI